MSIPRVRIKAKAKSYDGSTITETYIPTAKTLVRPGLETLAVSPSTNTNVFTALNFSADQLKMNRRYTSIVSVRVLMTKADSSTENKD